MPLIIEDEVLKEAGLSEQEAKVEIACRLYEARKLSKVAAGRLAGLDRVDFESELQARNIDIFRYTADDLKQDMDNLDRVLGKP